MRDFKGMKRQRGRNRGGGGPPSSGKPQQNANRAFDSAGPENVKVRGHAQSVYEKYQQLARDAFQAGDRILAEGYLQHAEHYFRLLRLIQPNRPTAEIVARDVFASGFDIDFEEEPDFSQPAQPTEPEPSSGYPQAEGGETGGSGAEDGQGEGGRDRPRYDNRDRSQNDRFQNDRYYNDRNQGDRSQGDRGQGGERPYNDRGQNDRSNGERYQGGGRGQNDRYPNDRPQGGERGFQGDRGNQGGDRVQGDRPQGERSQGERNSGERNQGGRDRYDRDRPRDDRPRDDRPREDRQGQDRFRGGEGRRDERPYTAQGEPRGDRPFEPRGDRPERAERQDRPERGDRRDRGFDRAEGEERGERSSADLAAEPATAAAPRDASSASPQLRSEDGGFSEAPAFLQAAMPAGVPAAPDVSGEDAPAAPRPRRPRTRRRPDADNGGESARGEADAGVAPSHDGLADEG